MASLPGEHVQTSNGMNGHHRAISEESLNSVAAIPTGADADNKRVEFNNSKNADAFAMNDLLPAQPSKADASDVATPAKLEDAQETLSQPPHEEDTSPQPDRKEDVKIESMPANERIPEENFTTAPQQEPTVSEKDISKSNQEDVDMADASLDHPVVNTDSTSAGGTIVADTSSARATSAYPRSSSGLLPSLRDDPAASPAVDSVMTDVPSNKVAREREDDNEDERSVKRARTEDGDVSPAHPVLQPQAESSTAPAQETKIDPSVIIPPRVRAATKAGSLADPKLDGATITPYANREIRRVLASVKKTKVGNNFKDPVYKKWPFLWDSYILRVAKPMDIGQMERNLRENSYASHGEFINDLFLIFENSVSFNGLGNMVTDEAKSLVDNFFTRLAEISAREPQKADKKDAKQLPTRQTEPRTATSRRESRGAATSPIEESVTAISASPISVSVQTAGAISSTAAPGAAEANTPVFAVPASGMPIIRRDSTKVDGDRPKRPIHPPKNRDLGYEPKNPKKKLPEFRFCEEVLKELVKQRHYEVNHWFLRPVDPVAMQIPTYHKVIKKPMDLGTMQTKLNLGEYNSAKDFESDMQLLVKNCRKFNIAGEVVDACNRLEELFKAKWTEKDSWIAAHTSHTVLSPAGGSKDDDSEEDVDDSDADADEISVAPSSATVDALVKRLEEENNRLSSLLMAKIPDMTMITTQQTVLNMIQKQIVEEKTKLAAAEAEKRSRKPAKAKLAKGKRMSGGTGSAKKAIGTGVGTTSKKTSSSTTKKTPKPKAFGQAEKNVVTDGINNLDMQQLEKAIEIIKKDTNQEESESGELELDIDQLSQDALGKLYDLIIKAFPHMKVKTERFKAAGEATSVNKPSKPKKHKPMGRLEQERNIEKLREIKAQFQRPGSGSQEPLPSVEVSQPTGEEESEEESDADSEEE